MSHSAALAALLSFLSSALPAHAQPAAESPAVISARVATLSALLDSEHRRMQLWKWGWGSTYAAATVGQVIPAFLLQDHETRKDLWVGSISSLVGALSMGLGPIRVPSAEGLPDDPQAALAELEKRIREGAARQRAGVAWYAHAGNVGVNLGLALILGLGFSHWKSAAISAGVGLAVGEINLLTQPTGLIRALPDPPLRSLRLAPLVGPRQNGVALSLDW